MANKTKSKNALRTTGPSICTVNLLVLISAIVTTLIGMGWLRSAKYRVDLLKAAPRPGPYENNALWNATTVPEDCKIEALRSSLDEVFERSETCGFESGSSTDKTFEVLSWDIIFVGIFVLMGIMVPVLILVLTLEICISVCIFRTWSVTKVAMLIDIDRDVESSDEKKKTDEPVEIVIFAK
jgi:hypothetical protein